MVILSDEGIHRHKLTERSAAQLECGVDVPRLGTDKELELLISGKNRLQNLRSARRNSDGIWSVASSNSKSCGSLGLSL